MANFNPRTKFLMKLGINEKPMVQPQNLISPLYTDAPAKQQDSGPSNSPDSKESSALNAKGTASVESTEDEEGNAETDTGFEIKMLDIKGKGDFRVNYLKRLSYAQVWIPNARKPPQHQTVTIFDWDDTLLCTSYINFRGDSDAPNPQLKKQYENIQKKALALLELAMKLGRVIIITNAVKGWVEYSSKKYLPGLTPILDRIMIISARNQFEAKYPGEYQQWKIQAFLGVQKKLDSQIITNLISIGDSPIEMEAVHVMGKEFSQALVKTVKFRDQPTPDELAKQLETLYQKFEKICLTPRSLKIGVERRSSHSSHRSSCNPSRISKDSRAAAPSEHSDSTFLPSTLSPPLPTSQSSLSGGLSSYHAHAHTNCSEHTRTVEISLSHSASSSSSCTSTASASNKEDDRSLSDRGSMVATGDSAASSGAGTHTESSAAQTHTESSDSRTHTTSSESRTETASSHPQIDARLTSTVAADVCARESLHANAEVGSENGVSSAKCREANAAASEASSSTRTADFLGGFRGNSSADHSQFGNLSIQRAFEAEMKKQAAYSAE